MDMTRHVESTETLHKEKNWKWK